MSEANVAFLRDGYDALQRGDIAAFKALAREHLEDDFEFHQVWDGRVMKGYEGTIEWLEDMRETWAEYRQSVEEILDLGDQVLVVVRIEARGGSSGVPVDEALAILWTFEGDRATEARSFTSREEALDSRT